MDDNGLKGSAGVKMDQALIDEAAAEFGVTDLVPFAPSGQKYVARCLRGSESVVLKVVELNGPHHQVTLERARREVDLLARINHPNVVQALSELRELGGSSTPTGVTWLEEFLDGEDLSARMGPSWQWDDVAVLARDIASGLSAIHAERAVHRDLSPGNIRATSAGSYVVMDPGLARHLELSTLTGVFQPGTWGYMSPEHAAMTRPTPASDVFGVGILMYQALSGEVPFAVRGDIDAYRVALRDQQAPSISVVRSDLAPNEAAIVDQCLQRQGARRFLDGAELLSAIEAL